LQSQKTWFDVAGVSDVTNDLVIVNQWISELREWSEVGLICIFIELCILN